MMNIGKANKRITLFEPTRTSDGMGGYATTMTNKGQCWAAFLSPRFASGTVEGSAEAVTITQGMVIRPRTVAKGWQVIYNSRRFDVLHVEDKEDTIILTTKEVKR